MVADMNEAMTKRAVLEAVRLKVAWRNRPQGWLVEAVLVEMRSHGLMADITAPSKKRLMAARHRTINPSGTGGGRGSRPEISRRCKGGGGGGGWW